MSADEASQGSTWSQHARQRLAAFDLALAQRFDEQAPVRELNRERAAFMDQVMCEAWQACLPGSPVTLIAVGGYGRASVYPQSDVDLLILVESAERRAHADAISRFVAMVWDARIPISHAVRTVGEAARACEEDITVLTAMMDARVLSGDGERFEALRAATSPRHMWSAARYFAAKREELRARHARFHDTSENLEPNIKEGPGGLRDMQTLRWMAMRVLGEPGLEALQAHGQLGADEHETLMRSGANLQKLRFGLHLVAGKREERLRFDHQRALAARLLHVEAASNADVEQVMQGFYRSAGLIQRISERLLQRFEEHLQGESTPVAIDADFDALNGYLAAHDPAWPAGDPSKIFRLFETWSTAAQLPALHSRTARALAESLPCIPAWMDADAGMRAQFMQLLRGPDAIRILIEMAKTGVLARWIPAFANVTGRMQFDLFHVYTVDQHTLMVLRTLALFQSGEDAERFSQAHTVMPRLRKPELLLLAALFHDIAKGRGGDHAELGAVDARDFCAAHDLQPADVDMVEWLVRHHLLMSVTAQKQDISDPDVITRFAHFVADRERLDYLYLLTCADIAGTSPKLWNAWKDRLLADLQVSTRLALRRGLEDPLAREERIEETRQAAVALLSDGSAAIPVINWLPADALLRYRPEQIAWMAQAIESSKDMLAAAHAVDDAGRALEIMVWSRDRRGLFAAIVMTLDRLGLEVLQARLMDAVDGMVLDVFHCLPRDATRVVDPREVERRLRTVLEKSSLMDESPARRTTHRHLRQFKITPQIAVSEQAGGRNLLSIVCNDRAGLLADVAAFLRKEGLRVHDARIATFGERAEDMFTVSPDNGESLTEARLSTLTAALEPILVGATH
ncbi:[protein-PII] uridylyltransferase [Lysobacter sp. HDW10]|uniref:[protein-PII] uridylyltransferase n=1 Tax=Lysobacter sp. HDW10 TaxID=2714936 RepID=UPI001409BE65|nr:[protein-PII] uridylyltransferase [Lysobacter sp. HDW10]QIK80167.1 [protein-PII] uridylyltransferase [Lysobacter sp. HDW10]